MLLRFFLTILSITNILPQGRGTGGQVDRRKGGQGDMGIGRHGDMGDRVTWGQGTGDRETWDRETSVYPK